MALEKLTENQFYNEPVDNMGGKTFQELVYPNFISRNNILNATNIPIVAAQNPAMVNYGIMGTDQANMFGGDIDDEYVPMPEEDSKEESGIAKLLNYLNPLGFIQNMFGKPQPYQQFSPGTTIDSRGIVNVAGVSTPYNMFGGDFYNPNTGLNRFDRAKARYNKTGSTADLFASSRTGAEFFRKLRERKIAKQIAAEEAAKAKRNITTFTSGDGGANIPIGPNNTGSRRGAADIPDKMRGTPQQYATDDIADFF